MRSKTSNSLTDFEIAVYGAVLEIPFGATRSYAWVAARIGRPRAARAVGNALHKNPYAPYVPCHRVIAADGSLGGYSAGVAKKKALLEKERRQKLRSAHEDQCPLAELRGDFSVTASGTLKSRRAEVRVKNPAHLSHPCKRSAHED